MSASVVQMAGSMLGRLAVFGILGAWAAGLGAAPTDGGPPVGPPLTDEQIAARTKVDGFEPAAGNQLSIVVNGFRRGQMDPCGCPSKQLGGFDKEAKVIRQIQASGRPVAMAEAGGLIREFAGDTDFERTKHLMTGLRKAGFSVANVGYPDLLGGAARLKDMATTAGLPLISANVTDVADNLLFPPFHIEQVGGPENQITVGFVGTTRQRIPGQPGLAGMYSPLPDQQQALKDLRIQDPAPRLKSVLPEVREKADVVVLLHFGRRDEVPALMTALGETSAALDLVVTGEYGGIIPVQTTETLPLAIMTGYEGRQVTHAMLELDAATRRPKKAGATVVEITQDIPSVPEFTELIIKSREAVRQAMPGFATGVPAVPRPPMGQP